MDEESLSFPSQQKELAKYDVIVWVTWMLASLSPTNWNLVKEFVSQGGGMVFVAGDRGYVQSLAATPMAELLPVQFPSDTKIHEDLRYVLTQQGRLQPVMQLVSGSLDGNENAEAWAKLQPPTYIKDVRALPGAEVWLEAKLRCGVVTDCR